MPALIFDCDGVLADTEHDGHMRAFNEMFAEKNLPVRWSVDDYREKVRIGGGKERLRSLLTPEFVAEAGLPTSAEEQDALVADWHRSKTAIYTSLVEAGVMPGRPGIKRIVQEAADAGWTLVVCSTSAEVSVRAVLKHAVGAELASLFSVYAGDIVPAKKPAPDIYLLAIRELGLDPADVVVVEDSENGMRASVAAALRTIVTVSTFTTEEDFSPASLVVTSLGEPEPGEAATVLRNPSELPIGRYVTLADCERLIHVAPTPDAGASAPAA
ncbi:HAD-IA family hydrolase [Microcella sp.]|uniref:HAD-IA family hydrolase n=1 Tax=Microcella sp. TaxID=1913979 RepID=UPI00391BE216